MKTIIKGKTLRDSWVGHTVNCKGCGGRFELEESDDPPTFHPEQDCSQSVDPACFSLWCPDIWMRHENYLPGGCVTAMDESLIDRLLAGFQPHRTRVVVRMKDPTSRAAVLVGTPLALRWLATVVGMRIQHVGGTLYLSGRRMAALGLADAPVGWAWPLPGHAAQLRTGEAKILDNINNDTRLSHIGLRGLGRLYHRLYKRGLIDADPPYAWRITDAGRRAVEHWRTNRGAL
jgi:hypothetical protein